MNSILNVSRDNEIGLVRLNRPEKDNALSNALRDAIETAFNDFAKDPTVKGIVLSGEGTNFCAGFDLEEVIATKLQSFNHRALEYHAAVYLIEKPVVVAIHGFALAGGMDLALCGDYIVTSDKTMLGHPEIRFGAPALVTSLARKIGPARALTLILDGGLIRAKDALAMGITNEITDQASLMKNAIAAARRLSRWAPEATAIMKRCANELFVGDVRTSLEREFKLFAANSNPDALLAAVKEYYKRL
ncbi:MAG: enoyl-CoA hydratase/isomerase family protein [Leptospirales bacterium]|nr:enoyl-CoA hydratase/isomerase family protein [Leptospirales bacterium]